MPDTASDAKKSNLIKSIQFNALLASGEKDRNGDGVVSPSEAHKNYRESLNNLGLGDLIGTESDLQAHKRIDTLMGGKSRTPDPKMLESYMNTARKIAHDAGLDVDEPAAPSKTPNNASKGTVARTI